MSLSSPTCAVTGAHGYVGGVIASALQHAGLNVISLSRSAPPSSAFPVRSFSLAEDIPEQTFQGVEVLVHCAYDFQAHGRSDIWRLNVDGTLRLFRAARSAGVKKIVFISSMSAYQGCKSLYGQAKLAVEHTANEFNFIIVRSGLVYGPRPLGMMGALIKLTSIPFILPVVGMGGQVLYLTHEEDLGRLATELTKSDRQGANPDDVAPIIAANESGKTLKQILQLISRVRGCGKKMLMPIPPGAIWIALRSGELLGLRMRLRSDSLVSLVNQEKNPDFSALQRYGIAFRPLEESSLIGLTRNNVASPN